MKKTKMTTLISIIALIFFSLTAKANTREGPYLGAGLEMSFNNYDLNTNYTATGVTTINNASNSQLLGNVFIGYGNTTASSIFWGAELGANFPSRSITVGSHPTLSYPGINVSETLNIQDYVTLDLLPGYAFGQNLLVYGRAGLVYGSLKLTQPSSGAIPSFSTSENTWGGRFGIGVNLAISTQFGIGVDYIYTTYANMNVNSSLFNTSYTANPSSNFIGFSILYAV